jgi:CBS domain-containing protein
MPEINPDTIVAEQLMSKAVVSVHPNQPLAEVELLLVEHRISGAPVVDRGRLVGVISRSDMARVDVLTESLDGLVSDEIQWDSQADGFQHPRRAAYREFHDRLSNLAVKDAMHEQVVTCHADTPISQVASDMVRHHIHRVIVVDGDQPIGIVSSLDIARIVAGAPLEVSAAR